MTRTELVIKKHLKRILEYYFPTDNTSFNYAISEIEKLFEEENVLLKSALMIEKQWCKDMHIDKQKVLDAINKLRKFMDKQKGVMGEDGFTYIPYADTMLFLDKIDKELELGGIKWQKTSAIKKCKSTDH